MMTFANEHFNHPLYRLLPDNSVGNDEMGLAAWDLSANERVLIQPYVNLTEPDWEQFRFTAQALGRLSHANLPQLRDAITMDAHTGALVWQVVEGESLEARLKRRGGPFPAFQMLEWTRQVAEAVAALHSWPAGFAGLDIRPHGVRITPDGQAMLVDFNLGSGAHSSFDETLPGRTALVDLPDLVTLPGRTALPNMAITQPSTNGQGIVGSPVLRDIYDLGALLYTGLIGEAPPDLAARQAGLLLPDLRSLNPDISPPIEAIILKAIHIAPEERYPTAQDFVDALDRVAQTRVAIRLAPDNESHVFPVEQLVVEDLGGVDQVANPRTIDSQGDLSRMSQPARRRNAFLAPAVVLLILILLALAGLALARGGNEPPDTAGNLTPSSVENALALDLLKSGGRTVLRQPAQSSPTPAAAVETVPPVTATPERPKATLPPAQASVISLEDWRESSFMPMFTGCPVSTAMCVRSDTNRGRISASDGYSAVILLRNPVKIDPAWENPALVFLYRVRSLRLANIPTEARTDTPPPTLRVRSADFDLLAENPLADTSDEWQPAVIDLSAFRGQEVSFQFLIGKYWGMLFLNDVRVVPNYAPPDGDPTDPLGP